MLTLDLVPSIVESYRAGVASAPVKQAGLTTEAMAKGSDAAAKVNRQNARNAYAYIVPPMVELRAAGLTYAAIADVLNAAGNRTRYKAKWDGPNVRRILGAYAA